MRSGETMQDSEGAGPQAEELRAANVANLREMVGMAGRHRETLLAVRECILALSPGHRTGYDWNADPLFLTLKEGRALNLIDDALKSTPASPQAETSEQDVPVLRITVTRDVATEYYAAEFRSADDKVGGMGDYSATPVGALANLCATLIQIDEDNSVERRQPTPVSPVEPEPPTVECCACGHLNTPQQATRLEGEWRSSGEYVCLDSDACSRRIAKCSEPTVEPEPCVWRESGNRLTRAPCFDSPWFGRHAVAAWKVCPYCGAPLKVEKP